MTPEQKSIYKRELLRAGMTTAGMSEAALLENYNKIKGIKADAEEIKAPEPAPKAKAPTPKAKAENADLANQIAALLSQNNGLSEARVIELIGAHATPVTTVAFKRNELPEVKIVGAHSQLDTVARVLKIAGITSTGWPYLCGPAGSGKTTLAKQLADGLSVPFYAKESLQDKFELIGFVDANGNYVQTDLYRAFKNGGVFLFDELDRSAPEAVVAFNMALANGRFTFPNGETVERHESCYFIAAGNTWGGATVEYNTAQTLDGSTRNRFTKIDVDYCNRLEVLAVAAACRAINDDYDIQTAGEWVDCVRQARKFARNNQLDVIFSPRQSIAGAALLADGMALAEVKNLIIGAELTQAQMQQMGAL